MTTLIVCRHGATDWNLLGRYQGQSDVPLNSDGLRQAELLAHELRDEPIQAVYASTLQRAWKTAEAVARYHGISVHRDPRLKEVDEGDWEGLTLAEIVTRYPEQHALWVQCKFESRPTSGESIAEMHARLSSSVADITSAHPDGLVVIVTHKVALNVIRSIVTGEPTETALNNIPANCSMWRWEVSATALVADGMEIAKA